LSAACPDDAIQIDMINMTQGGLNVEKTNFFSEAVAPAQGMTGPSGEPMGAANVKKS
jgi:hypothetical protein